jgi:hypothetical protein
MKTPPLAVLLFIPLAALDAGDVAKQIRLDPSTPGACSKASAL